LRSMLSTPGGGETGSESEGEGEPAPGGPWALLVTQRGYAKRVPVASFRQTSRGRQGVSGLKLAPAGAGAEADVLASLRVVGLPPSRSAVGARRGSSEQEEEAAATSAEEEVVVASENGIINRCRVSSVTVQTRLARGTQLMKLDAGDRVRATAVLPAVIPEQ
jgi:DNA gyrase subunit A